MAEQDLQLFLQKVEELQRLVNSIEQFTCRKDLLAACENHNQVVELARSWGYEIGRRWGEPSIEIEKQLHVSNVFGEQLPPDGHEHTHVLKETPTWRLELILSCNASTEDEEWYDQTEHEWILLLRGSATLELQKPNEFLHLNLGDYLYLAPHRLHRVQRTDSSPGMIWLALFWHEAKR